MTPAQLNRATLARQQLLARHPGDPAAMTRHLVAVQAQEPAAPSLALWNRLDGFAPDDLHAALHDGTLLKATLLRLTLHLVHADDHPTFHAAMRPTLRGARLGDRRFSASGLTPADADAAVDDVLAHLAQAPRTNAEMTAWLTARLGDADRAERMWWALRHTAPLRHAPGDGPWTFGRRPAYLPAATAPVAGRPDDHLPGLVARYLAAYGPATVADAAQFLGVQRGRVKAAVVALDDQLVRTTGPDGRELLDVPDAPSPDGDVRAPARLLGMWDNVLLAHLDRTRLLPETLRRVVIRPNGDVLPTVLVDGHVVGVWRSTDDGVEVSTFTDLPASAWEELAQEATGLRAFLAARGDPDPFGRFAHWWAKLPTPARVRSLPG